MICFRHNDMDGFCSAAIVMYHTNTYDTSKFISSKYDKEEDKRNYQHVIDTADKNEDIYIVDLSFTEDTYQFLEALLKKGHKVIWIDHHDSSVQLISRHPELAPNRSDYNLKGIVSKEGSGAYLAYKYFNPDKVVPEFIKMVSDYDTFANTNPNSILYKLGIDIYIDGNDEMGKYKVFTDQLKRLNFTPNGDNILTTDSLAIINKGKTVNEYKTANDASHLKAYGYESQLEDGTKIYCINRKSNSLIFGDKYKEYDAVVVYCFDGTKFNYSMYSHDNVYDCGKYAESKGGGGHKGAAGFSSTELLFRKVE